MVGLGGDLQEFTSHESTGPSIQERDRGLITRMRAGFTTLSMHYVS
jgi:hypothetical protein